jgi:trigger factor
MNISQSNKDELNALITVTITKDDYQDKATKLLSDYRKNANIPGFRKGTAPMSMIKKQYEKAIIFDEVNKLLQDSLNNYIHEQKLDILGHPLPVSQNDIDWDADTLNFDFEIGLSPKFNVDLTKSNNIIRYNIVADDKMIEEQIGRITESMGKIESQEVVEEGFTITAQLTNSENNIDTTATFKLDKFANEAVKNSFIGKKFEDIVTFNTKGLFNNDHDLEDFLKVSHDIVHGLAIDIQAEIKAITKTVPANLDQDIFDRVFGKDTVTNEADFRLKLKEDAENQLRQQGEQKFLNDVTDYLLTSTNIELPSEFLTKWIQLSGEQKLTTEEAEKAFAESVNAFKYQLLENKLVEENKLQVTFDEIKNTTAERIKAQYASYGIMDVEEKELDEIVMRVLKNKDEMKRLSDQLLSQNILKLYLEKVPATIQDITFEEFLNLVKH